MEFYELEQLNAEAQREQDFKKNAIGQITRDSLAWLRSREFHARYSPILHLVIEKSSYRRSIMDIVRGGINHDSIYVPGDTAGDLPAKWTLYRPQTLFMGGDTAAVIYQEMGIRVLDWDVKEYRRVVIRYDVTETSRRVKIAATCWEPKIKEVRLSFEYMIDELLKDYDATITKG